MCLKYDNEEKNEKTEEMNRDEQCLKDDKEEKEVPCLIKGSEEQP